MVKCLPCGFTAQMSCNMDRASMGFHYCSMCHKERYRLLDIVTVLIRSVFLSWCWHKWPRVCVIKYYSIALQKIERDLHLFCDTKSSIVNPVDICKWLSFVVMASENIWAIWWAMLKLQQIFMIFFYKKFSWQLKNHYVWISCTLTGTLWLWKGTYFNIKMLEFVIKKACTHCCCFSLSLAYCHMQYFP